MSKRTVLFNKAICLLANGATVANGAGFVLSREMKEMLGTRMSEKF